MVSLDVVWWIVFSRLTNHSGRIIISIFMVAMLLGLIAIIAAWISRTGWDRLVPKFAVSAIFIWHFIGLGLLALIGLIWIPIFVGERIISHKSPETIEGPARSSHWSRRDFLR